MSYIRTENGIYEVEKNELGDLVKIDGGFIMLDDVKDKIIKEADNLSELCDEFVCIPNDSKPYRPYLIYGVDIKQFYVANKHTNFEVYGAIWCKWGLKYVAKMNENGDLELL